MAVAVVVAARVGVDVAAAGRGAGRATGPQPINSDKAISYRIRAMGRIVAWLRPSAPGKSIAEPTRVLAFARA